MNRNNNSSKSNQNENSSSNNKADLSNSNLTNNVVVATNESIKLIAESIGISNLSEEACRDLASDLTFVVKSILNDGQKFARRSRRKKMLSSDIDYSLKSRSIEPIYGFQSLDTIPFRCATSTGGNGSGRSVYYTEEQVVDLNELISVNNQTVKLPNDFVINAHWLAIEGIQPSLPENPQIVSRDQQKKEATEGPSSISQKDKQHQILQKRQQNENLVKLKTLIPHDLSIEQQIYYKEITEACVGSDEPKREEALNSLKHDPGLHQLLPHIVLFIAEGVRLNIVQLNMAMLTYLMRMSKSLIENKTIYLEKYLHELLPSILSCILSKQICARPDVDNHSVLREFSANIVGQLVKSYSPTIPSLQSRIIRVYLNSLQSDKTTLSTLFGAIAGLSELGNEICEAFVFSLIKSIGERIAQILDSTATNQEKNPAEKVKQQIIKIVSTILKQKPPQPNEFDYLTSEFGAYFGGFIHAQLMKLRNQQLTAAQNQIASAINKQSRTEVITPQFNRNQPVIDNNQSKGFISNVSQSNIQTNTSNASASASTTTTTTTTTTKILNQTNEFVNSPNSQKLVKVTNVTFSSVQNKAQTNSNLITPNSVQSTNFSNMITDNNNLSSASNSPIKNNEYTSNTNNDNDNRNFFNNTDIMEENNESRLNNNNNNNNNDTAHNLTNDLTSDDTNNMTTSDVNLSDTIEPLGDALDKIE